MQSLPNRVIAVTKDDSSVAGLGRLESSLIVTGESIPSKQVTVATM